MGNPLRGVVPGEPGSDVSLPELFKGELGDGAADAGGSPKRRIMNDNRLSVLCAAYVKLDAGDSLLQDQPEGREGVFRR